MTDYNLWKSNFKRISIKKRDNLKVQYQHVPVRYKHNAIEFNKKQITSRYFRVLINIQ
ncbi:MAG TPA: hypothetical protein DDX29_09810 [Clostridiales bacterium]|nr:hypothetical protein [Clostridiales bacterium]